MLLSLLVAASAASPSEILIRPEALRAHVRFLADDLLEGRGAGSRGYDAAAAYVAARFEALGLEPAGDAGGYFQPVPLRHSTLDPARSSLTLERRDGSRPLALGREFVLWADPSRLETELRAPVVFVGMGVVASEAGLDDYAGVDVRGKIVLIMSGAPASFPSGQRAYHSSLRRKRELAAARGAIGILGFVSPVDQERIPWQRLAREVESGDMAWLEADGTPHGAPSQLRGIGTLHPEAARLLFDGAARSYDAATQDAMAGRPSSLELGVVAAIRAGARHRELASPNVLGRIPGSDPHLARETVVFTAHLDHLGLGPPQDGDPIYNGAYDNASGVASLLEIARAFARLPKAPARSLVFAALTAEEHGLLGADYLAHHPPGRLEDLVAALNVDMFLTLYPPAEVVAFGAEHSSLGELVAEAAAAEGLGVGPDPFPEQVIFIRSDQYAFVRRGVPSVMLACGLRSADPRSDGASAFRSWIGTVYHTPKDDASQPMDFAAAARVTRVYFRIGQAVAMHPEPPAWKPGDFFGRAFGRPQP